MARSKPPNIFLDRLESEANSAEKALRDEINRVFPEGSMVRAKWGKGWIQGCVSTAAWCGRTVQIRTATGQIHNKHFRDVELMDEQKTRITRKAKR